MTPYNFSSLLFAFTSLVIGLLIWLKRRDRVGAIYFIYSLAMAFWGRRCAVVSPRFIVPKHSYQLTKLFINYNNFG